MKKFLNIMFPLCVMLVALIFAVPNESLNVFASEYSYTAEIVEEYDTTFLNGISSIDCVSFNCIPYYRINYTTPRNVTFTLDCGGSFSYRSTFDRLYIQLNRWGAINLNSDCFTSSIMLLGSFRCTYNSSMYYATCTGTLSSVLISDGLLPGDAHTTGNLCQITSLPDEMPSSAIQYRNYTTNDTNLSQYLDFDSTTNYAYDVFESIDFIYDNTSYSAFKYFTGRSGANFCFGDILSSVSKFYINFCSGSSSTGVNLARSNKYYFIIDFTFNSLANFDYTFGSLGLRIKDFEIKVNRPVYRTENTLVLYNYDYDCAISKITSVEYALSKDSDIYKAKYTGSVPNSSTIGFICGELQNRLYDEYIYIYLTFKDNLVDCTEQSCFSLGFDFNFSKFYEPLVIDTSNDFGSFGLPSLNKPKDWYDIGGWIYYGFIWVFFYNPIVKPVSKVLFPILSLMISLVNFLLDFPLGVFITSYIGFMVVLKFLSSLVPKGHVDYVSNISNNIVSYGGKVQNKIITKRESRLLNKNNQLIRNKYKGKNTNLIKNHKLLKLAKRKVYVKGLKNSKAKNQVKSKSQIEKEIKSFWSNIEIVDM